MLLGRRGRSPYLKGTLPWSKAGERGSTLVARPDWQRVIRGVLKRAQSGRILLEEHQKLLANSRMAAVRDFLKTDTFTTALELKSTDSFAKGYKTCEESFDRSRLDITLDGDLQPYPPDPELKDDEFMVLRAEMEAEADAEGKDDEAA
ncbi:UNVERIFIED_CONTAM: hypothetical protein Sindi_2982700 [Sesamum indicum]